MPEVSQDAFEVTNPLKPLVTPEMMRARSNSSNQKPQLPELLELRDPPRDSKRHESESEMDVFTTGMFNKGFKRALGHSDYWICDRVTTFVHACFQAYFVFLLCCSVFVCLDFDHIILLQLTKCTSNKTKPNDN